MSFPVKHFSDNCRQVIYDNRFHNEFADAYLFKFFSLQILAESRQ